MKKRIFSMLLCLCMVLMLLPATALAEGNDTADLQALLNAGGTVTLEKDYTITSTLQVDNTVTLDLNGHVIKMTGSGSVLRVNQNSLTLQDSSVAKLGVITGGNATNGGGVFVAYDASFVMNGGTISNCTAANQGGGVCIVGSFTMNGGTISNCTADDGGGVYNGGSFTMNGGTISNCTATRGSGVYNNVKSSFTMNGGSIVDNSGSTNLSIQNGVIAVRVNGGEITGFYNTGHVNIEKDADKSGTTFYGEVYNSLGTINAGIYKGAVTNDKGHYDNIPGTISGGTFEGTVTNNRYAVISGGTFMKQVQNIGIISGGMFYGGIKGGTILGNTVTFMKNGSRYALEVVADGNKVVAPMEPAAVEGRKFTGWYTDEALTEEYEFGSTLPESITLYAGFEPVTYTVEYDGGAEFGLCSDVKTHGEDLTLRGETFKLDGYVQSGWVDASGKKYDFGERYTTDADVTLYPVWDPIVTLTVPFTTTVKLGGTGEPGKTDFEVALIDSQGNELLYDDAYFSVLVTTEGAGDYDGELTITAPLSWLMDMLYEGAFVRQYDDGEEGWTYDETVWGVRLYKQQIAARAVSDVQYSLLVYQTYTMDDGSFALHLNAGPVDAMTFTNTYTKLDEVPKTGDNSNLTLWVTLLTVSVAGMIGTAMYSKRRGSFSVK